MLASRQLAGRSTLQYYSPSILQQAGFASNEIAVILSSVVAAVNSIGTVVGMLLIDRKGRRKLALFSLFGVTRALTLLAAAFHGAELHPPSVHQPRSKAVSDLICPAMPVDGTPSNCITCFASTCGFCGDLMLPGTRLVRNETASQFCTQSSRSWYNAGCPSDYGWLAFLSLILYIAAFSPGMGPVPWAVNAEIYPQRYRGTGGAVGTTVNWTLNFVIAQTFLSLVKLWGASRTFILCAGISATAFAFVMIAVPETKGLRLEEVEKMLEDVVQAGGLLGNWYRGGWCAVSREINPEGNGAAAAAGNLERESQ